jgi:hypothetical protein
MDSRVMFSGSGKSGQAGAKEQADTNTSRHMRQHAPDRRCPTEQVCGATAWQADNPKSKNKRFM